jgi:quercetin dioxygenase-like cupin family protein
MRIVRYSDVQPHEDVPGVFRRVVIGPEHGAPRFVMRVFELLPGCSTPYHIHDWEHEVFVISGQGVVRSSISETPIGGGTAVFVAPGEEHCFTNRGDGILKVICVIPTQGHFDAGQCGPNEGDRAGS